MRNLLLLLIILFYGATAKSAALPVMNSNFTVLSPATPVNPVFNLTTAKVKDVEKLLGRKLKLKEKLALKFIQWKYKREVTKKADNETDKGKTAMILGIIGVALLIVPYLFIASIPLAILAIVFGNQARKVNKKDNKALIGIILGWVTIGIILIALALLIVFLSSWTWGWG